VIRRFSILLFILILASCEADLEVFKEGPPTPVVYCVLDQDKPVQKLRLTRSYNSNRASEPPDSPDSIRFREAIDIALEQVDGDNVEKRAFFDPVRIEKDSGFFPVAENWIYQTEMVILPDKTYKLIVYLNESDKIIYSTCTTVSPFHIVNPAYPEIRDIHLQVDHNPQFYWTSSKNAGIYQMGFILHYDEFTAETTESKSVQIDLNTRFVPDPSEHFISQSINSTQFYLKLNEMLDHNPKVIRRFTGLDAMIICGGEELAYLIRLQQAGQSFSLMEFTNVYNGIGIFSSRMIRTTGGFRLTAQTIDSLAYGRYTYGLNFLDRNGVREKGGEE
jgi:hypothetical protein